MKVIILAAGRGTRLRPLTYGIPKPLLPVKGRPMIDWVIRSVMHPTIDEIIVAVPGTAGNDIEERTLSHIHGICIDSYLKNTKYDVPITTIPTPQRETAGDIKYILEERGLQTGSILVVYGDNLTQFDINEMIGYHNKVHRELGVPATVLLFEAPENELNRFGIAKLNKINNFDIIETFVEKPSLENAPSKFANGGYYILELDDVFDLLPQKRIQVERSLFPTLAQQHKLAGFITKLPYWIDVGTIDAYERANKFAHENLIIPPPVPNEK